MQRIMHGSGTSSLLRLTRYWNGFDRMVVADSAFASLKTAEALHKHCGLRLIHWSSEDCSQASDSRKHGFRNVITIIGVTIVSVLQANINGRQYMTVGWNDKKLKMFISSTSRTTEALYPAYKKLFVSPHQKTEKVHHVMFSTKK